MYVYQSLENISYEEIAECFNLAFSDYNIPMQLKKDDIKLRLEASGVDKKYSYGAFFENKMIGFIFNSCSNYNGERVVFDVGTGIIPNHRGNKVFSNLFDYTQFKLKKYGFKKYYLEVLQNNIKAISAYCIFCSKNGNIVGMGFLNEVDLKTLIENLTSKYINFNVKNIDLSETKILSLFYSLSFNEVVKQYEMVKDI